MSERRKGKGVFGAILDQGFLLAMLYCSLGLVLELLHARLPAPIYERAAATFYGLPLQLLVQLDLQSPLIGAVAQGRMPVWIAGAIVPAVGVGTILLVSVALGGALRLFATVRSFRHD